MPQLTVPGGTLDYDVVDLTPPWAPARGTILFHHGLGASRGIWAGWLPALIDGWRIVRFDMRGHGTSSWPDAAARLDLETLTDDLFAVLDEVGAARAHLVGESIGGTIALNAALRAPARVASLTVSNGAHVGASIQSVQDWQRILSGGGAAAWSAHMMPGRFFPGAISPAAYRWYETQQAKCSPDVLLRGLAALVGADMAARLPGLNLPVLLMHPDDSPFIPVALMAEFRNAVPDARLHVIGRARHGMPFSHAGVCAGLLRGFLNEVG